MNLKNMALKFGLTFIILMIGQIQLIKLYLQAWSVCDYETLLLDSIYNYTYHVLSKLNPDYVQVGNEINHGFLHPIRSY